MTFVRIKGFQIFKDRHGRWRCYHRNTRTAVDLAKNPIGSVGFLAECHRITSLYEADTPTRAGTLGLLILCYKKSEEFAELAERTQSDYMRCADYLQPIRDTPISVFDAPLVKKISRKAARAKGRRLGNYIIQFLSLLFNWGIDEGHTRVNPAAKVKKIKTPKDAPQPNRPWKDKEREEVLAVLPPHVLLPVSLMMFCALDPQDALQLKRSVIRNGEIDTRRGKTGNPVFIPLPKPVLEAMRAQQQHNSVTVCANSFGQPWTASGFRAVWRRIRLRLEAEGRIDPGLTLKGLRHTVATILREMGKDYGEIADMLGQSTEAMARHYSRRADMTEKNSATISDLSAEMDKRRTKVVKPIRKSVKPKE